jgi:methyl-accepting chemotaxis protein
MDKVTQGNAASAEETSAAAAQLNSQTVALNNAIASLRQLIGGGISGPEPAASPPIVSPAHPAESRSAARV